MKVGLELKRLYDRNKFFEFEFNDTIELRQFLETFLKKDVVGEKLELRIWRKDK